MSVTLDKRILRTLIAVVGLIASGAAIAECPDPVGRERSSRSWPETSAARSPTSRARSGSGRHGAWPHPWRAEYSFMIRHVLRFRREYRVSHPGHDLFTFAGHKGPQGPWGIGGLAVAPHVIMNSPAATCERPLAGDAPPCAPLPGYCDAGSVTLLCSFI